MNTLKRGVVGVWRGGLIVMAGGTILASSCSTSEVNAVLTGVELVADQFDHSQNDNISFGHWLSSALGH